MIPSAFIIVGPAPTGDTICKACGNPYHLHSGNICGLCRHPVEHHDQDRPNGTIPISFDHDCLPGRVRMANARHPNDLNRMDRLALGRHERRTAGEAA